MKWLISEAVKAFKDFWEPCRDWRFWVIFIIAWCMLMYFRKLI